MVKSPQYLESRQYLEILWKEIVELPARQREALLFNLREPTTGNVVALLVVTGISTLHELAAVLDLSHAELTELWDVLPLDDASIAERIGGTPQQVIDLREAARQRLARRMRANSGG